MLCRKVIGYGLTILDERTDNQKDNEHYDIGFTHKTCRNRWKQRYTPEPRKPRTDEDRAKEKRHRAPMTPTPVHLDQGVPPKKRRQKP